MNATQEEFPIRINGVEYTMSYKDDSLFEGEDIAHRTWHQWHVNLCHGFYMPTLLHHIKDLFAVSLERHHPEIPFLDRRKLVTVANVVSIFAIQWSLFGHIALQMRENNQKVGQMLILLRPQPRPMESR